MKFAQSLEDHMVPEWRKQYLNYKIGKKKLKKLSKKPSVLNSIKSTPKSFDKNTSNKPIRRYSDNPDSNTPKTKSSHISTSLVALDEAENENENDNDNDNGNNNSTSIINNHDISSTTKSHDFNEDQITLDSANSSFALPAAALSVNDVIYGSSKTPFPRTSTENNLNNKSNTSHDKTPLLSSRQSVYNNAQTPSQISTPNGFNPMRRKSSLSVLFDSFKRSPSLPINKTTATELEDLANYARQQFINWVDSELEKVNSFYTERENACVQRFLVLQDQILQLENQKLESKKKWLFRKRLIQNQHLHHDGNPVNIEADGDIEDDFDEDDDDEDDDDRYDEYLRSGIVNGYNRVNRGVFDAAQRNIKLLSFWTRRKLRIINKFDMPSLPKFEWLKTDGKVEKQYYEAGYYSNSDDETDDDNVDNENNNINNPNNYSTGHHREGSTSSTAHIRDFQRRKKNPKEEFAKHNVPYFVARRMIKKAIYELYRSMELLKSYRLMNRIAFRKLIKKYDKTTGDSLLNDYMKKVDETYFSKSDILDNLMTNVEESYTRYFENGNRKVSITKLRTSAIETTYYISDYFSGLFIGISLPFLVYSIYLGLHKTIVGELKNGKYLLQIWGGFFIIVAMSWLFTINCLVWTKFKVNYKFIFEFNQHDTLDYKQYMLLPSFFLLVGGFIAWFSFEDFWPNEFSGYDFPWVFLAISVSVLLCPFDMFFLNARLWLLSTLTRLLLSGFYPVEFRDFFLGDIFCSLTYSISNVSMFFCIYSKHWNDCVVCGSSRSRLLGFLQCLPSIWRFLQCFRRYADTGDWFPHLANMCKYTVSTLYYMSLSLYRIETVNKYKILLIFWATLNSVYSSIWDIIMDWSLLQFDSKNFLLRDEITFKYETVYYLAMIVDVILRFQWIFYVLFPTQIQQSAITSFCIAIAEIIRRFIWIFFRMENEHATNVHLFRASRESPLPYPIIKRLTNSPRFMHNDDINNNDNSKDLTDQDIRKRKGKIDNNGNNNQYIHIKTPQLAFSNSNNVHYDNNNAIPSTILPDNFSRNSSRNNLSINNNYKRGHEMDLENNIDDEDNNRNNNHSIVSSVSRYVQHLSNAMRNAHIKDFQRRKINKKQMIQQEEDEEEEEEEDNDNED